MTLSRPLESGTQAVCNPKLAARAAVIAVAVLVGAVPAPAQIIITPTFDSSITTNPNSAALQTDINNAVALYESIFTDNINVSILFRYSTTAPDGSALASGVLGVSNYPLISEPYNSYTTALANDSPKSANDITALAHLPAPSAFPNNPSKIDISSANGRALGLNTAGIMNSTGGLGGGGTFDGIVTINSSVNFALTRPVGNSGQFDVMQSIEHEMDEVLGLGSILPSTTDFTGSAAVRPQDLFRYSAPGAISLSASSSVSSYFSIDGGATDIVAYNQNPGGDYGDWGASPIPLVQLAFSFPNTESDISRDSPEGVALDVIGYNLAPVPEPGALALASLGTGAVSTYGRWRRKRPG
jgi:hypothetical protein